MLKKTAIAIALIVLAVLGFAATRPDTLRVARTTSINAPPDKIFPLINDLHRFTTWSPYEGRDPAMTRTFTGAPSGEGAAYAWQGNSDVGKGRMEITQSSPPSTVVIALDFDEPFEAHNTVNFLLEPQGAATNVTWAMHGPCTYMTKLIGLFVDMDHMIGTDFDAGLANLKRIAES